MQTEPARGDLRHGQRVNRQGDPHQHQRDPGIDVGVRVLPKERQTERRIVPIGPDKRSMAIQAKNASANTIIETPPALAALFMIPPA